jgi:hypothetical protein
VRFFSELVCPLLKGKAGMQSVPNDYRILGIEIDIIEDFLKITKVMFPLADKANFYLERNGISGINVAITNQRDALSHLSTILTNEQLDYPGRKAQLAHCEEHLRRAILEPYEIALTIKIESCKTLFEEYKERVLPIKDLFSTLQSAPDADSIANIINRLDDMRIQGRDAKRINIINEDWENGVKVLIEASELAMDLENKLENYLGRAKQINIEAEILKFNQKNQQLSRKSHRLAWWGIIATITTFVIGAILAWKLATG